MYTIWKLTVASIKMFVRNKQAIFFTFFTPLLIMVIFGVIGFDKTPKITVGVAIQGTLSAPTQGFLDTLRKVSVFKLDYGSEQEERKALEGGNRSIVLLLTNSAILSPQELSQPGAHPGTLTILSNSGDQLAGTAISIINQVIDQTTFAYSHTQPAVTVSVQEVNSHNLKYIDFLLPGLVALSVMQLSVFSVAFVFVEYKEKGILKRIMATPVRPYQFVTANIITRLLISLIQAAFFLAIGVIFFKAHVIGSYFLVALIVILGAIMFLGLGFTVSGMSSTTESVPAFANLVVFPMIFLGGTFFSVDAMPSWLQIIAKILPLTFFSTALRDVTTKGAGFLDVGWNLLWMLTWSIILFFLSVKTFKFDSKR